MLRIPIEVFTTNHMDLDKATRIWQLGIEAMKKFGDDQLWGSVTFRYQKGDVIGVDILQSIK